jgi:hypothetical protein
MTMEHRNLILAYLLTWALQLGYLGRVLLGWRRARR